MAEKYTLNWHTFSEHLQWMFKDLYEEEKHSDVTLVCDDQTQFKAHKIVLRACSEKIPLLIWIKLAEMNTTRSIFLKLHFGI